MVLAGGRGRRVEEGQSTLGLRGAAVVVRSYPSAFEVFFYGGRQRRASDLLSNLLAAGLGAAAPRCQDPLRESSPWARIVVVLPNSYRLAGRTRETADGDELVDVLRMLEHHRASQVSPLDTCFGVWMEHVEHLDLAADALQRLAQVALRDVFGHLLEDDPPIVELLVPPLELFTDHVLAAGERSAEEEVPLEAHDGAEGVERPSSENAEASDGSLLLAARGVLNPTPVFESLDRVYLSEVSEVLGYVFFAATRGDACYVYHMR